MGGLGANIGSEEWEKAQKKKLDAKLFSEKVRLGVQQQASHGYVRSIPKQQVREKTAREKALEFAKNVPKPKAQVKYVGGPQGQTTDAGDRSSVHS